MFPFKVTWCSFFFHRHKVPIWEFREADVWRWRKPSSVSLVKKSHQQWKGGGLFGGHGKPWDLLADQRFKQRKSCPNFPPFCKEEGGRSEEYQKPKLGCIYKYKLKQLATKLLPKDEAQKGGVIPVWNSPIGVPQGIWNFRVEPSWFKSSWKFFSSFEQWKKGLPWLFSLYRGLYNPQLCEDYNEPFVGFP